MNTELAQALAARQRGYRSNRYLQAVRPDVHLKQKWFLSLDHLELMYGGAAGGGKSDALLMGAIQYIDIPDYSAIIFRRTYSDLALPGALMDRARRWFTGILKEKDGGKRWESEEGGVLQFGYLDNEGDKYRYQGGEYQFCAFDELTQFAEEDYKYLFSRLRRPSDIDSDNPLAHVPLRMRSATNPGGKFSEWVKKSFISRKYLDSDPDTQFSKVWGLKSQCLLCNGLGHIVIKHEEIGCPVCRHTGKSDKYFIPARLEDNPSIDLMAYEQSLAQLPPVERAQLRSGRWDMVSEGKLFKSQWIKRYRFRGENIELDTPYGKKLIDSTMWWPLITVDTASKLKTVNDYTVISVWAVCEPKLELCLLEVFKDRLLIPEILPKIEEYYERWKARYLIIEEASSGIAVIQEAFLKSTKNMSLYPFNPHTTDKVSRATDAMNRMSTSMVFFPESKDSIIVDCINEMLLFPDSAHDDFVDTFSMAGWYTAGHYRNIQASEGAAPATQFRPGINHHRIGAPLTKPRFNRY